MFNLFKFNSFKIYFTYLIYLTWFDISSYADRFTNLMKRLELDLHVWLIQ